MLETIVSDERAVAQQEPQRTLTLGSRARTESIDSTHERPIAVLTGENYVDTIPSSPDADDARISLNNTWV